MIGYKWDARGIVHLNVFHRVGGLYPNSVYVSYCQRSC